MGFGGRTNDTEPARSGWFGLEVDGGLRAAFLELSLGSEANPAELVDSAELRQ